jgi:hypothetical protein
MFTIVMISEICTSPLRSQSPTQGGLGLDVGVAEGMNEAVVLAVGVTDGVPGRVDVTVGACVDVGVGDWLEVAVDVAVKVVVGVGV